jgi:hypothetical protein
LRVAEKHVLLPPASGDMHRSFELLLNSILKLRDKPRNKEKVEEKKLNVYENLDLLLKVFDIARFAYDGALGVFVRDHSNSLKNHVPTKVSDPVLRSVDCVLVEYSDETNCKQLPSTRIVLVLTFSFLLTPYFLCLGQQD